jgi:inhibitor of KinA sporulation pathway (predicted exonuclease)
MIMKNLLVSLDLEMNQPSGKIIQIGAILGNVETGEVVSQFESKVNPAEVLAPAIIALTKITQKEVDQAPALIDAYYALSLWLDSYAQLRVLNPLTWGGGDTETLRVQLNMEMGRWPFGRRWIDTKTLYVAWRMAQGKDISGGLARAMTKLGLAFQGQKHNALDDATNTFRMYRALLKQFQLSTYVASATPVNKVA